MFSILTVLFEPAPFPEIITVVPDGEGLDDGETDGLADGDPEGEVLGDGDTEGAIEGDGVGKFAAAVKELFIFCAVSENSPKTD